MVKIDFTGVKNINEFTIVITPRRKNAIKKALWIMIGNCDGARSEDGIGFNQDDVEDGHELAMLDVLTNKEATDAAEMLRKYWRQIPEEIYSEIYKK